MPQYLAPGVYVEEVSSGPPPIEGVGTNTVGCAGVTRRGPISGTPTLVTSYAEFVRTFGGPVAFTGFDGWTDLAPAMRGFFDNGGQRAYVARVAAATAAGDTAEGTLKGGIVTRLTRNTATAPATATKTLRVASTRAITVGTKLILRMTRDGVTTDSPLLTATAVDKATGEVTVDVDISTTTIFEASRTVVLTDAASGLDADGLPSALGAPGDPEPDTFKLIAASPGTWGAGVQVAPAHESAARSTAKTFVSGAVDDNKVELLSTAGFYVDAWVEIALEGSVRYRKVLAVDGPVLTLSGSALTDADVVPAAPATPAVIATCEFVLALSWTDPVERVTITERYGGLTLEQVSGRYYVDRLAASDLVVVDATAPASNDPMFFPSAPDGLADRLSGGADTVPGDQDVVGTDNGPNAKSGLLALADVDEIAILATPGLTAQAVQNALITQCETLMDRFAVLDPVDDGSGGPADVQEISDQRDLYDSKYAALYYPRVVIADPFDATKRRALAPSGHVLGVYSRVDATRGVHKAPANEVIRGILDVETLVPKGVQEILNPRNINVIRDLRSMQRGLRIYGARCVTADAEWNYINVRRLFIFLEESLGEGTQWVVFEPNDRRLWDRVRQSVSLFLTRVWADGALMGDKPEEAFFVRVDETTMTEDDLLNGRLVMEIGIAPVRPAEFVVIRIGQWLGGSAVQEI